METVSRRTGSDDWGEGPFVDALRGRTGQQDLLLSTVVANRNRTELERLIGCFTKKVPLRLDLRRDPDFTQMVALTRRSLLGVLQHQDLPFEAVLQEVLGPRAQVHEPRAQPTS